MRRGHACLGMLAAPRAAGARQRLRRHHHHAAVAHAALGDHVLGEVLHGAGLALEHCHFHATVMVEVDMQRRQRQFVMIVEGLGQPLGQFARGMVVDVDQGGDAVALGVQRLASLADAGAGEVADRLGAVLVAAGGDDAVELGHQLVIDGDGHALHASLANSGSAGSRRWAVGAGHGCPARNGRMDGTGAGASAAVSSSPIPAVGQCAAMPRPAGSPPPPLPARHPPRLPLRHRPLAATPSAHCRRATRPCRRVIRPLAAAQKQARPDEIRAGRFDRRGGGWGRCAPIATGVFFGAGRGPLVAAVGLRWKR